MSDYLAESYDKALRENELLRSRLAEVDSALGAWGRNEAGDSATVIRIAKAVGAMDVALKVSTQDRPPFASTEHKPGCAVFSSSPFRAQRPDCDCGKMAVTDRENDA